MWLNSPPTICIVGAGFSGICAGIKLKTELGLDNFTIFDENSEVGGTWLVNTYPGCACDIPSHLYSFSFEPNPKWSEVYSSQQEIWTYLKNISEKHELYSNIKFNQKVEHLLWNEGIQKWQVGVTDKTTGSERNFTYDFVISCIGGLRAPNIPQEFLPFKGPRIHSAEWDATVSLEGKTVGVVGSGASAVQIIPAIVDKVKKLVVYQRHPTWVVPRTQMEIPSWIQRIFQVLPLAQKIYRVMIFWSNEIMFSGFQADSLVNKLSAKYASRHLNKQIPDNPELREKLSPNYTFGCKRVTPSSHYYPALASSNVQVIRSKITKVKPKSILTEDGNETELDVLILATGFKVQDYFAPVKITGKRGVDIMDLWKREGPSAYLGICSSVLPNMFFLLGPNTGLGHNTIVFTIECQMNWVIELLRKTRSVKASLVSVTKSAEEDFMEKMLENMKTTVWGTYECGSWYADHRGVITALSPYSLVTYWKNTRRLNPSHFNFQ